MKVIAPKDIVFFERTQDGLITHSTSSKLFEKRIIYLKDVIEPNMADDIVGQLILLESINDEAPIDIYIHSPGGHVDCMHAIIDMMQFIKPPCHTYGLGLVASAASIILAAGAKGHRAAMPNSRIMIHQPSSGAYGQVSDILIEADESRKIKKQLNEMLADFTGQPFDVIERDTDRNFYLSADEAVAYGLVDKVIKRV